MSLSGMINLAVRVPAIDDLDSRKPVTNRGIFGSVLSPPTTNIRDEIWKQLLNADAVSDAMLRPVGWNGTKTPQQSPVVEHVPVPKPEPTAIAVMHQKYLAEYAAVAAKVGVLPPELAVENFKAVLKKLDYPVYALQEVVAYMDSKAAMESKNRMGWYWRPLRNADLMLGEAFGNSGRQNSSNPASDWYSGDSRFGRTPYERLVPLHALKRIAAIEKISRDPVKFMVSDYALAEMITHPDPFLMAVIPNARLHDGIGRFVIDFWDEPGFGIKEMLK